MGFKPRFEVYKSLWQKPAISNEVLWGPTMADEEAKKKEDENEMRE